MGDWRIIMYEIPLEKIPNQSFRVNLGASLFEITVKTSKELTLLSVEGDKVNCYSAICFPNYKISIPGLSGVLAFRCQDNEYPTYTKFGELHKLYYIEEDK